MLVQQMRSERTDIFKRFARLSGFVGALQSFEHVSLFQLIEVRRQIDSSAGSSSSDAIRVGL